MKPMLPAEYRKALDRLGFSNRGFCLMIGVDDRTGRRWLEEGPAPGSVAALLRLALAQKLDAEQLRELLDPRPTKSKILPSRAADRARVAQKSSAI